MNDKSAQSGFSLVETLVALAIIALALPAFYRTVANAYRASAASQLQDTALQLARSQLDKAIADENLKPGIMEGMGDNGIGWRLSVASLDPDNPVSFTYWLTLETVSSTGGQLVKLETVKIGRRTQ